MTEVNDSKNRIDSDKKPASAPNISGQKEPAAVFSTQKEPGAPQESKGSLPPSTRKSRFQQIIRRGLIGLAVLLVVFAAGGVTVGLLYVRPANQERTRLEQELNQAEARIQDQEAKLAEYKSQETEKQSIQQALTNSQTHVALLRVLVDVNNARIALEAQDPDRARLYLSKTPQKIEQLGQSLGAESDGAISSMLQRLTLVNDEISRSRSAAQTDLSIIANDLIQIENTFFTLP